jgi:orotate phosphoribosyltransferase
MHVLVESILYRNGVEDIIMELNIDYCKEDLLSLLKMHMTIGKSIVTSAGSISNVYIDCRPIVLSYTGQKSIISSINRICSSLSRSGFVAGTGVCGIHMANALCHMNDDFCGVIHVRSEVKNHGTKEIVELPMNYFEGASAIILDDVITTGKSILHCLNSLQKKGIECDGVVTLVDREEGGVYNICEKYQVQVFPLFSKSDLMGDH